MALRLGWFNAMAPRFWLNLQNEYCMRFAKRKHQAVIALRIRVHVASD